MIERSDTLVVGSGIAGLLFALKMAARGSVTVLTKAERVESSGFWGEKFVCFLRTRSYSRSPGLPVGERETVRFRGCLLLRGGCKGWGLSVLGFDFWEESDLLGLGCGAEEREQDLSVLRLEVDDEVMARLSA